METLTKSGHFDAKHNFVYLRELMRQVVGQTFHKKFQEKYKKRRSLEHGEEYLKLFSKFLMVEFHFDSPEIDVILKSPKAELYFIYHMFFSPH